MDEAQIWKQAKEQADWEAFKARSCMRGAGGLLAIMGLVCMLVRAMSIKHPVGDLWFLESVLTAAAGIYLYWRGR